MKDFGMAELVVMGLAMLFVYLSSLAFFVNGLLLIFVPGLFRLVTEVSPYIEIGTFVSHVEPTPRNLMVLGWTVSALVTLDLVLDAARSVER